MNNSNLLCLMDRKLQVIRQGNVRSSTEPLHYPLAILPIAHQLRIFSHFFLSRDAWKCSASRWRITFFCRIKWERAIRESEFVLWHVHWSAFFHRQRQSCSLVNNIQTTKFVYRDIAHRSHTKKKQKKQKKEILWIKETKCRKPQIVAKFTHHIAQSAYCLSERKNSFNKFHINHEQNVKK